ncbi:MAG: IS30 family transposase [Candidatus Ruthia sp.]|jgi:transposase, IS30 family|nr:IS30 family transposase [Candidatus Ruthturnera sp.]
MTYKQLTQKQRYHIAALKGEGFTQTAIAKRIGSSPSTISRELKRNSGKSGYRGRLAAYRTEKRRRQAKKFIKLDLAMCSMIANLAKSYLSPEQMSGRLLKELGIKISHETIYRHIWRDKKEGGSLYNFLRTKGKKYRARGSSKDKRGQIKNAIRIDERPSIVDEKSRIGDWEIDTVIGKNHKQALVTIVERKTKFMVMKKVENKSAELVEAATIELLSPYKDRVHTITADNGKEFANHEKVADALDWEYYFAHPYSSWERGLNENTNGLVRQFFKKGSKFEGITDKMVNKVKNLLNRRPRKTLDYATPQEEFFGKIFGVDCALQG